MILADTLQKVDLKCSDGVIRKTFKQNAASCYMAACPDVNNVFGSCYT